MELKKFQFKTKAKKAEHEKHQSDEIVFYIKKKYLFTIEMYVLINGILLKCQRYKSAIGQMHNLMKQMIF